MTTIRDQALAEMEKNLENNKVSTMVRVLSQMQRSEEYYKKNMETFYKAIADIEAATSDEDLMAARQHIPN